MSATLIALTETWELPRRLPPAQRRMMRADADRMEAALHALAAQIVGLYLAAFDHLAFAEPALDIDSGHLGDTEFEQAVASASGSAEAFFGHGGSPDVSSVVQQQQLYGSALVKGMTSAAKGEINDAISQGIANGDSRETIRAAIEGTAAAQVMPDWRARMIAQTEVSRSYNGISQGALKAAGEDYMQWLDGQAGACAECANLDGAIIDITGSFISSDNVTAEYPPLHPNCRCGVAGATAQEYQQQPGFADLTYLDANGDLVSAVSGTVAETEPDNTLGAVDDIAHEAKMGSPPATKVDTTHLWDDYGPPADHATPVKEPAPSAVEPTVSMAPTAKAVKDFIDANPDLQGVQIAQKYAKASGVSMNATKNALIDEGYTVKMLKDAPSGTVPDPANVPKPKQNAKKVPKSAAVEKLPEFQTEFAQPHFETDQAYWDGLKQVSGAKGSNPGGVYEDAAGNQYYLKKYADPTMGASEVYATKVYDFMGVGVPDTAVITKGGEQWFASKIEDVKQLSGAELNKYILAHPEEAARLFVTSSFLQNWDVVGMTYDNLQLGPNGLVVVDSGGSLLYRAKGGAKPYDPKASEFDAFLDLSGKNPQAATAFRNLFDDPAAIESALKTADYLKANLGYLTQNLPPGVVIDRAAMESKLTDITSRLQRKLIQQESEAAWKSITAIADGDQAAIAAFKAGIDKTVEENAALRQQIASSWSGSSSSDLSMYAKAKLANIIYGTDPAAAYIEELKRYKGSDYDPKYDQQNRDLYAKWEKTYGATIDRTLRDVYQTNQARLKADLGKYIKPNGTITIYRGINSGTQGGREAIAAVADAMANGGTPVWNANWLQSFSIKQSVAERFAHEGSDSMVLRMDVPTDWVFMTPQYLNSKGGYHAGEAEPVIIGPLGGYTLTPDRIQHLRHGGRKLFAEETPGTADPNTYFVTFALGDDEEDWKRHQWDESSEEWKAQWQKESPSSSPESKS